MKSIKYTLAKYLILLAIAGFVVLCVLANKGSTAPFENVRSAVEGVIDPESMRDAGNKGLRRYYKLKETEFDGVLLYQSVSGMSAEEILLLKVKDPSQLEAVKAAIEKRREARINDFAAYAPNEAALLENAELIVKGEYLLYLPYSGADQVKEAFLTALGE